MGASASWESSAPLTVFSPTHQEWQRSQSLQPDVLIRKARLRALPVKQCRELVQLGVFGLLVACGLLLFFLLIFFFFFNPEPHLCAGPPPTVLKLWRILEPKGKDSDTFGGFVWGVVGSHLPQRGARQETPSQLPSLQSWTSIGKRVMLTSVSDGTQRWFPL